MSGYVLVICVHPWLSVVLFCLTGLAMSNIAAERLSFAQTLAGLDRAEAHLVKILARLRRAADIPSQAKLLDVGAAQGLMLIAADRLGLRATGVEPWEPARLLACQLAEHCGTKIDIRPGQAETLDFDDESFDIVHALAVAEHVRDPQTMFNEAWRVLRPGGVFWFTTTNKLCPRQNEIAWFPCFSWYPAPLQTKLTRWTQRRKPSWVGNTHSPAMHWFTPGKTRSMLSQAGFNKILDSWDARLDSEGGALHKIALRFIRSASLPKLLANLCCQGSSYVAVKIGK